MRDFKIHAPNLLWATGETLTLIVTTNKLDIKLIMSSDCVEEVNGRWRACDGSFLGELINTRLTTAMSENKADIVVSYVIDAENLQEKVDSICTGFYEFTERLNEKVETNRLAILKLQAPKRIMSV